MTTKTYKAAVDLRDCVGKLVSRTNDGGVWLAKKNQPIIGAIKRGAKKGGMVTVQLDGPTGPAQKPLKTLTLPGGFGYSGAGNMKPGPYTTCRKCKALVAVSDVRESGGYCGNCSPTIVQDANALALQKYRHYVQRLVDCIIRPGDNVRPYTMGEAMEELIVFYVQDQKTPQVKNVEPELPEEFD